MKIYKIVLSLIMMLSFFCISSSMASEEEKRAFQVFGKLSSLSPQNDPRYIGIELFDETNDKITGEMYFSCDDSLKIEQKRNLKDIRFGDTVMIKYEETLEPDIDGGQEIERKAKSIKFLKSIGRVTLKESTREEANIISEIQETLKGQQ